MMEKPKKLKCPNCGKPTVWSPDNPYKPFCSSRCKLIDLGEWANESRKIPGGVVEEDPEELD